MGLKSSLRLLLRVSKLELGKSKRKYDRRITVFLALVLIISYFSVQTLSTHDSEVGLYTISFSGKSSFPELRKALSDKFVEINGSADVIVGNGAIFVKKTDRSIAAADEVISIMKREYRDEIEKEYGEKAYPLIIGVQYVPRGKLSVGYVKTVKSIEEIKKRAESGNETVYSSPEDIEMPGLIGRMVVAFALVIPAYFASQISSSSLVEDKMSRRIEVLLSAANPLPLLFGKMLPYILASVLASVALSIYLRMPLSFLFIVPVILFLFSAQHLAATLSRSYREATFLILVVSLFIAIYVFIPAVFSGSIPVSRISPVTNMFDYVDGTLNIEYALLSVFHFITMSAVLFYITSKTLDLDVLFGKSIVGKLIDVSGNTLDRTWKFFAASSLSIPFAFMTEFFLLILLFVLPPRLALPTLILAIALVEEIAKGLIISVNPETKFAIATALGFFTGEKILVVLNIAHEYNAVFLGQYLILPLIVHISTVTVFAYLYRRTRSFSLPLTASTTLHFLYNYTVVLLLAS